MCKMCKFCKILFKIFAILAALAGVGATVYFALKKWKEVNVFGEDDKVESFVSCSCLDDDSASCDLPSE